MQLISFFSVLRACVYVCERGIAGKLAAKPVMPALHYEILIYLRPDKRKVGRTVMRLVDAVLSEAGWLTEARERRERAFTPSALNCTD